MSRSWLRAVAVAGALVAVAVGAGLGAVARNGPATASARAEAAAQAAAQASVAGQHNDELRRQNEVLRGDVLAQARFAEELVPMALANRLTGVNVLVVSVAYTVDDNAVDNNTMDSANHTDNVDGVCRMLTRAGASITGTIAVTEKFIDQRYQDELLDLAHVALPPSVVGGLSTHVDGVRASSALLSAVLLARTPVVAELDRRSVLTSYASQGYLAGTGDVAGSADVAIVLVGRHGPRRGRAGLGRRVRPGGQGHCRGERTRRCR